MNTLGDDEGSSSVGEDVSFLTAQNPSESSSRPSVVPAEDSLSPALVRAMRLHALMEFVWGLQWTNTKSTERAEHVAEAYAANLHSRRCDAARERKSALSNTAAKTWLESPKYWPLDIERWLQFAGNKTNSSIGADNQLTSYSGLVWLDLNDIDQLAMLLVKDLLRSSHRAHLFERMARIPYTADRGLDKHLATSRLKTAVGEDAADLLPQLSTCCVNYCVLSFECAEFFGSDVSELSGSEIVENLQNLTDTPAGLYMLPAFVDALVEGKHTQHIDALWQSVFDSLEKLRITNLCPRALNVLTSLSGIPALREALVRQKFWLRISVYHRTFLGRLIGQVSMVDWDGSTDHGTPTMSELRNYVHPQGISPALTPFLQRIKTAHSKHIKLCVQFLKTLLKHGGSVKEAVLDWFKSTMEQNVDQSKLSFRHYQSQMPGLDTHHERMTFIIQHMCPFSAGLNICWVLFELCKPIIVEKITEIDALYGEFCRSMESHGGLLGESWLTEARMTSDEHLNGLNLRFSKEKPQKFITQIFWLALKAQRIFFYQSVNDALLRQIHVVQLVTNATDAQLISPLKDRLCGEVILWQSLLRIEDFSSSYLHFMDLLNAFISRAIFLKTNRSEEALHPHPTCQSLGIPASLKLPETEDCVSPEFQALPLVYISDAYEAFSKYICISMSPTLIGQSSNCIDNAFSSTNCELLALVLLTIIGGSDHLINSPPMRLDIGGRCIAALDNCEKLRNRVCQTYTAERMLASSICSGFVHAQRLSYYLRIDMRLILTRELERLLANEKFRDSMDEFANSHQSEFERFLLFFASNTSYVLDEALTYLTEIKSRESKPENSTANFPLTDPNPTRAAHIAGDNEAFSREADRLAQEIEGTRNVEEMGFEQLTNQCQNFMAAGSASLNAFSQLDARCFKFIRSSKILIEPTISCLDSCLASLVGPKCMALKVTNFSKYKFKPREFLADLVHIYVKLMGDEPCNQVLKTIRDDQRFYSKKLFDKATRIVTREGLATQETRSKFAILVDQLNAGDEENDWLDELIMSGEVPDEFIDPLMSDVMRDPVLLPTSNVIVERNVIERHLLSDQFDPFNRMPLEKSMLIAQDTLKRRIEEFLDKAKKTRHP